MARLNEGDRVRVCGNKNFLGKVGLLTDFRKDRTKAFVALDCGVAQWFWQHELTREKEGATMAERPKVGDRVRVMFGGVIHRDDKSGLPFLVSIDGGHGLATTWVREQDVTVLPAEDPAPEPERSPTEIELRLRRLEQALQDTPSPFLRLDGVERKVEGLEAIDRTGFAALANTAARVEVLERQMASLRSLFNEASSV